MPHKGESSYQTYMRFFSTVKSGNTIDKGRDFSESTGQGSVALSPVRTAAATLGVEDARNNVQLKTFAEFDKKLRDYLPLGGIQSNLSGE